MRFLTMAAAMLCGVDALAFGPSGNPDDQIRLYWQGDVRMASNIVEIGCNVAMNGDSAIYDYETLRIRKPAFVRKELTAAKSAGLDYVHYLKIANHQALGAKYPTVGRDRSKDFRVPDLSDERCFSELKAAAVAALDITPLDDPNLVGIQPSSEVRDRSHPSFTPMLAARYRAHSGREIPTEATGRFAPNWRDMEDFPVGRVIPDDWPLYDFYSWFWREGDRWNEYQSFVAEEVSKRTGGRVWTYYDPVVRTPPVWGSGGSVTLVNHWVYCQPDPYSISHLVSEENAMARGRLGQGVMVQIQDIAYRATMAPKELPEGKLPPAWYRACPDTKFLTCPHDMMREAIWGAYSRRTDGVCHYGFNSLFGLSPEEYAESNAKGYFTSDTKTREVIADMARRIGIPLGPLLRAAPEHAPRVAVLESAPSAFFAARYTWGWAGSVFDVGLLAVKASLMPYVLYTEQIRRDGIPASVETLLLPGCEVLTETEFAAIKAFQKRGGIVLADMWCVPGILPDGDIPEFVRTKMGDADYAAIGAAADKLLKTISVKHLPYVVTSTRDLIAHARKAGSAADLLVVYNDRRTLGDDVGQWNAVLEKGLPASGKVSLARKAGAVYDLERHCRVDFEIVCGRTRLTVDLKPADGVALLVADRPLAPLSVRTSGNDVTVTSADRDVMIPIGVTVPGRRTFYGVVKNGVWSKSFDGGAVGASVKNLADGSVTSASPGD